MASAIDRHAFIEWHESRMAELDYPEAIRDEFRRARTHWLSRVIEGKE